MAARALSEVSVGDVVGPVTVPVARDTLVAYANASGDQNPIHQDEAFARSVGLPDVIAHGMWTMGASATVVTDWAGDAGRVVEFGTRFTKPVVVPVSGERAGRAGGRQGRRRRDRPGHRRRHHDLRGREGARPLHRGRAARLMRELHDEPIAAHTTMRVGGPAARMVVVETADELVDAVREVDDADEPLLVLGRGVQPRGRPTPGSPGTVVKVETRGVVVDSPDQCGGANVVVAAGEDWDGFVAQAVEEGWSGVEALSGIPGSDRGDAGAERRRLRPGGRADHRAGAGVGPARGAGAHDDARSTAGFTYRDSVFKATDRYVVIDVMFQLVPGTMSQPVRYADLADPAGGRGGGAGAARRGARRGAGPAAAARDGARRRRPRHLELRVVLHQPGPAGRRSSRPWRRGWRRGSATDAAAPPRFAGPRAASRPAPRGSSSRRGSPRGSGCPGPAALSTKHTLAVTNRGGATASDVAALAREVRDGVRDTFGVTLVNEPVLVGHAL